MVDEYCSLLLRTIRSMLTSYLREITISMGGLTLVKRYRSLLSSRMDVDDLILLLEIRRIMAPPSRLAKFYEY